MQTLKDKTTTPEVKQLFESSVKIIFRYALGHTVLRAKGNKIETQSILTAMQNLGHKFEILEDKVCV